MSNFFRRLPRLAVAVAAAFVAGCSIHPIPDNVSPYATEDIVRNVRCEAKEAVRARIKRALDERGLSGIQPDTVLENKFDLEKIYRQDPILAKKFVGYGTSTIAYDFDFSINENNDKSGGATFFIPFASGGSFTLGLDGGVSKKRKGSRTFRTEEKFRDLVRLNCRDWVQPDRNILYPLTGSIGVDRVINTFIEVSEFGGGEADYSDEIKFTTTLSSSINPALVLEPVVNHFRLIDANAEIKNGRSDVHQVTISISFPQIDLRRARSDMSSGALSLSELSEDTRVRALQNSCIVTNRAREDRFGKLRLTAPEEYCRQGAASFQ